MRAFAIVTAIMIASTSPAAADMALDFPSWGDIPLCTSGRPNIVGNPEFVLSQVPDGTATVEFRLKDLDVPSYDHGGATLRMTGSGTVPFGTFTYKSPCPPGGVHTYEWTATARDGAGQVLATARARRSYPD